jgi:hypothetical protein
LIESSRELGNDVIFGKRHGVFSFLVEMLQQRIPHFGTSCHQGQAI